MSETSKQQQPPPGPAEPKRKTWPRRIGIYSLRVLLIILISYVVEKCIEFFSGEGIAHLISVLTKRLSLTPRFIEVLERMDRDLNCFNSFGSANDKPLKRFRVGA